MALVACPQLMNSLHQRLKQLEKKEDDEYRIECVHEPLFEWGALNVLPEWMILAFHLITHSLARMMTFCVPYVVVLPKSLGQLDWLANFLLVFCHADFYTCIL